MNYADSENLPTHRNCTFEQVRLFGLFLLREKDDTVRELICTPWFFYKKWNSLESLFVAEAACQEMFKRFLAFREEFLRLN